MPPNTQNYIWRSAQGGVFALLLMITTDATKADVLLGFMVGVSFDPRHFWWFL
jgi:hypothetical protein